MNRILKISQQTVWQLIGKAITSLSTIVILAIITRSYGEAGTGIYTLALTFLSFFFLATDLGLNAYILSKFNTDQDGINKLLGIRLVWSIILTFLANIVAIFVPFKNPLFNQFIFFAAINIVYYGLFTTTNLLFQVKLSYGKSVLASSLGSLAIIPVIFLLTILKVPISHMAIALMFGWFLTVVFSFSLAAKLYKFRIVFPSFIYILQLVKEAWPLSLTLLLNVLYFRIDAFILSAYYPLNEVGNYNLAYQIFQSALVIPTFIMNGYYPLMLADLEMKLKNFQQIKNDFLKQISFAAVIMLALSLVLAGLTYHLAPYITFILAGNGFLGTISSLKILSLSFPAFFLSALLMWSYVSLKKYQSMVLIYAFGLIVNLILNLIYIPQYSYFAASWVTVFSEYLILVLQIIMLF